LDNNRLKVITNDKDEIIHWINRNMPYDTRMLVLDGGAPYGDYSIRIITGGGIFVPYFDNSLRAYTIEPSPDYIDAVNTLNPDVISKLKISHIYLEEAKYQTLPNIRRRQLMNDTYFETIYLDYSQGEWKKILKVKPTYLSDSQISILDGSIKQLPSLIPKDSTVYIGDWEDTHPWSSVRKAIIFILREYDLYYLIGPGYYLNLDTNYPIKEPNTLNPSDFLILPKSQSHTDICDNSCDYTIIWQDITNTFTLWKKID